jgi:multiple antibiotic resistance protein
MNEWNELFKITVALLAIVNPVGGVPVFLSATAGWSDDDRHRTARVAAVTVFWVLAAAVMLGTNLLDFFGISIPSFLVGGGILLLMLAVSMLQAKESWIRQTPEEAVEAAEKDAIGVVPLAIPLLAGPGAISTMIIATHKSAAFGFKLKLLIPVLVISLIVWLALLVSVRMANRLGTTGINIITRLMGLILAAMAVEFIHQGVVELFPKLLS